MPLFFFYITLACVLLFILLVVILMYFLFLNKKQFAHTEKSSRCFKNTPFFLQNKIQPAL
jgi:heme/copper-type cytochrome/quinol oxidase subunit 2